MSNNYKRRGMSPLLAFILGILFGIILLVGTLVAAVFIALNYKLDNIEANKDGDNYVYINADPENGGVATILDLIKKVVEITGDYNELSIAEVENLLPVTTGITQLLYDKLNEYVVIDAEELKQVKFGALGDYVQEKVMDIRPAALLESFGGGLSDNKLISTFLNGKEADYVTDGFADFPVFYDIYEKTETGFARQGDNAVLNAGQAQYLIEKGEQFRLYFYNFKSARSENNAFITYKEDGNYVFAPEEQYSYQSNEQTAKLSGNYYYDGETKVEVTPVTFGSFSDGSAFDSLDEMAVLDLVGSWDDLTEKILGDISVGDLIDGDVDFEGIVNGIEVSTFMDVKPTDGLMAFLAFGITDIQGEGYSYTAIYHPAEGEPQPCIVTVEDEIIKEVVLPDGSEVHKTGINDVPDQVSRLTKTLKLKDVITIDESDKVMSKLGEYIIDEVGNAVDDLTLDDFMEVGLTRKDGKLQLASSDTILAYVVYGITDIKEADGAITATYHPVDGAQFVCNVTENDGKISGVYMQDGTAIKGTTVKTVSDRVGGVTSDLKIGAIMDVADNKILEAIKNSTIESLPSDIDKLSINELYSEDIYGREIYLAEEFEESYLYYVFEDDVYKLVRNLSAQEFEQGKYYTYGEANSTWKLLLNKNGREQPYSVNELGSLIDNVKNNIQNTTMAELAEAEIISLNDSQLGVKIPDGRTIGELQLSEFIDEFINMLDSMPRQNG